MLVLSDDADVAERQMHAIIFYLTAFGYVDGDFDPTERDAIRQQIRALVEQRARTVLGDHEASLRQDVVDRWTQHFHEVLDEVDNSIQENLLEPVAEGENQRDFVTAKLKLRCFELFKQFEEEHRGVLLQAVDEVMHADGVVHPSEENLRSELEELLSAPIEIAEEELEPVSLRNTVIENARRLTPRQANHPFFEEYESNYSRDPGQFSEQAARDLRLIRKTMDVFEAQRRAGQGKLGAAVDVSEFAGQPSFLDGHIYVVPPQPDTPYELLVLGDLHGCYSCLKAALLQADFFGKVQAYHDDPQNNPNMKLVLLGDYIDRGKFSYNGILRTVMRLVTTVPDHVYMLRGNHEYYVELNGRVYGGVKPAEAITDLLDVASNEVFVAYMHFFESLPNMLLFDRTLFVHAGIPRDDSIAQKWVGLASLNDPELRFQMLWSDPSEAEYIPSHLQKSTARFPFGKKQFRSFMSRLGCTTMVRGHERVVEGFRVVYDLPDVRLLNLFSAGGATNGDLPPRSNYREVTPMALTIRYQNGVSQFSPFVIDYERYNDPDYNAFFRDPTEASGSRAVE